MNAPLVAGPKDIPRESATTSRDGAPEVPVLCWSECNRGDYIRYHLNGLRPAIVRGAIDHWPAHGKWTPQFFQERYGTLKVSADGTVWTLRALIDCILASTPQRPAPYLRNQRLEKWPRELLADISPLPQCTSPNYLKSPLFPSRESHTYLEFYLGGAGAAFPNLHYDLRHAHAFLMQLYGTKEYMLYAPDQAPFLYTRSGIEANKSVISDIDSVDLARFPLFAQAKGVRFLLNAGETLFVPGGWWHTARIITTSITVSVNAATAGNWDDYRRDYCAGIAQRSRIKAAVLSPYLALLGVLLSIFKT